MTTILFLHHFGGIGGALTSLSNVIRALPRDRFKSIVVCPPGDAVGLFEGTGAEVRIAPRPIFGFGHVSGISHNALHPLFLVETVAAVGESGLLGTLLSREPGRDHPPELDHHRPHGDLGKTAPANASSVPCEKRPPGGSSACGPHGFGIFSRPKWMRSASFRTSIAATQAVERRSSR